MSKGKRFRMGRAVMVSVPEGLAPKLQELVRVLDKRDNPVGDMEILIKLLN